MECLTVQKTTKAVIEQNIVISARLQMMINHCPKFREMNLYISPVKYQLDSIYSDKEETRKNYRGNNATMGPQ